MNITGNLLSSFGTQINNEELMSSDEQSQIVSSNILQQQNQFQIDHNIQFDSNAICPQNFDSQF